MPRLWMARQRTIARAQSLASDPSMMYLRTAERLAQIGRMLAVRQIERRLIGSHGVLKRLADGSFAVVVSRQLSPTRQLYTIAHEISHIILDKFFPHIHQDPVLRTGVKGDHLERIVDRVASELLMPQRRTIELLQDQCQRLRQRDACLDRFMVINAVRHAMGVSQSALVFRLLELPELITVLIRLSSNGDPRIGRGGSVVRSDAVNAFVVEGGRDKLLQTIANERAETSRHRVEVNSTCGPRVLWCDGWNRKLPTRYGTRHEYWAIGWSWKVPGIPNYDDSSQGSALCSAFVHDGTAYTHSG